MSNMREKTKLQRELLKKNTAFIFTDAHMEEFLRLRAEVGDPNTLYHYNPAMDLGISLDTQRTNGEGVKRVAGLGFVIFNYFRDPEMARQTGLGGPLHPKHNKVRALQFGSIAAKPSWANKPPVVIEALGAVSCLHRLEYFCRGQTMIDLFMDSKSIVEAWTNKSLDEMAPALQDLMIELSRWPLRMHYVAGKDHVLADTLGRHCVEGSEGHDERVEMLERRVTYPRLYGGEGSEWALEEPDREIKLMKLVEMVQTSMEEEEEEEDPDGVADLQAPAVGMCFADTFEEAEKDLNYKTVAQWVKEGRSKAEVLKAGKSNPVHHYKQEWDGLAVLEDKQGRLVLTLDDCRVVAPVGLRSKLLAIAHKPHKGERLTLAFLKRYFFWKNMSQHVRDVCRSCLACTQYSPARPKEPEVRMRRRPPRPWHTVGVDFMQFHTEHLLVVIDYLTSYIWCHAFRATPNTKQTIDALDACARANGGYFSILCSDSGPQFASAEFKQWLSDKYIIHRVSSAHYPQSNGKIEKCVSEIRSMFDRAEAAKGCRLNAGEKAELVAVYNDTPRREGAASPARLHFRRQYRHPGFPAMELAVWEAGEEVLAWEEKEKRKEGAIARVAANNRKPLRLSVGLKVLCMDKEGVYSLPGEVVGLRSQRSCWVLMEDSGRTLLRNRKFLAADPTFAQPQVYSLKCNLGGDMEGGECANKAMSGGSVVSAKSILRSQAQLQCQPGQPKKRVKFQDQTQTMSTSPLPAGASTQSVENAGAATHSAENAQHAARNVPLLLTEVVHRATPHAGAPSQPSENVQLQQPPPRPAGAPSQPLENVQQQQPAEGQSQPAENAQQVASSQPSGQVQQSQQVEEGSRESAGEPSEQPRQRRTTWAQVVQGFSALEEVPRLRRRIEELEEENGRLLEDNAIWREAPTHHVREVLQEGGEIEVEEAQVEQAEVSEGEEEEEENEDSIYEGESESGEEITDREVVAEFLEGVEAREGVQVPAAVRERLLAASLTSVRQDSHSVSCSHCSRLAAIFPFYVRACIQPGRGEESDLIALRSYCSIPGNLTLLLFQREFFSPVEE